jgi:ankyrin repeat protein
MSVHEIAPGLWIWRIEHPRWKAGVDWQPVVTTTWGETGGERIVIDPLAPPPGDRDMWKWLDDHPPTVAVVLKPDHVRDVDLFVQRFGARGFGPIYYDPGDLPNPRRPLRSIKPGTELPGGAVALFEGRGGLETPLWLPAQRTIVFADGLTERGGILRVWTSQWHEERALPALRDMLTLPFERVIISHGEPVHDRAAFERALALPPWPASPLHIAAWSGSLGLVRTRVERGADVNALDEQYAGTPLDFAQWGEQQGVVEYLRSVGARSSPTAKRPSD